MHSMKTLSFRRFVRRASVSTVLLLGSAATVHGDTIDLGLAGDFAVLGLNGTAINNSLVTVHGNEGVSQGGSLVNMAPSTVTGNVYQYSAGLYSGPGSVGGSVVTDPALLAQANVDARAASSNAAALSPTQTFGSINSATTVTGNGGLNVIDVNGDIKNSLTLSGSANDTFIVNVTGTVTFGGSTVLGLAGGVTANHVLYNFTGTSGTITSHVGNTFNGTLLAPTYSFNLDGTFNGEIIGGGSSICLLSGAVVNGMPFSPLSPPPPPPPPPGVPAPSSVLLSAIGLVSCLLVRGVRRRSPVAG